MAGFQSMAQDFCADAILRVIGDGAAPDWESSFPDLEEPPLVNAIQLKPRDA